MDKKINLASARAEFLSQLKNVLRHEPPGSGIVAICFGLQSRSDGNREYPVLYLSGSTSFDEDDSDWACIEDDSWVPDGRYLELAALAKQNAEDWESVEDAVVELLKTCQAEITALLGTPPGRHIATGWDDGDLQLLFVAKHAKA